MGIMLREPSPGKRGMGDMSNLKKGGKRDEIR